MNRLSLCLKKQRRIIERLKKCDIYPCSGFDKNYLLVFDVELGMDAIQKMINEGYYKSIENFDSFYCADIEFTDFYQGRDKKKYNRKTKKNLIALGIAWRERVTKEYPEADVTIIVHREDNGWCLDTYNNRIEIDDAIYL